MRGTRRPARDNPAVTRFIPAHAGNTTSKPSCFSPGPVHPRACGEHLGLALSVLLTAGSSPRMRGTRTQPVREGPERRFIPAHAGNTDSGEDPVAAALVHPRACGEHLVCHELRSDDTGSSPRMRGTRWFAPHSRSGSRFIPAHAGNTRRTQRSQRLQRFIPAHAGNTPPAGHSQTR